MSKYTSSDISVSAMESDALGADFELSSSCPAPYKNFDKGALLGVGGEVEGGIGEILARLERLEGEVLELRARDVRREEELEELRKDNLRLRDYILKGAAIKPGDITSDRLEGIYEGLTQRKNQPICISGISFGGQKLTKRERQNLTKHFRQDTRFIVGKAPSWARIARKSRQGLWVYLADQNPAWPGYSLR